MSLRPGFFFFMRLADLSHWPQILPGIEALRQKTGAAWTAAEVYQAVASGEYRLFVAPEGFVVAKVRIRFGVPEMYIWLAYGQGQVVERYEAEILALARAAGARRITFQSPRLGWRRKGWTMETISYRRDL